MIISAKVLFVLLLTWAACCGQKPCCTPKQYEMKVGMRSYAEGGRRTHGRTIITDVYIPRLAFDYTGKKASVREYIRTGRVFQNLTTVIDYNKGQAYIVIWGKKPNCMKVKIQKKMNDPCIPSAARHTGNITVGYGRGSFLADNWILYKPKQVQTYPGTSRTRWGTFVSILVEREGCIPVSEEVDIMFKGRRSNAGLFYFDFTEGIKNPSVFNIPAICKRAEESDITQLSDLAFHAMLKYTM